MYITEQYTVQIKKGGNIMQNFLLMCSKKRLIFCTAAFMAFMLNAMDQPSPCIDQQNNCSERKDLMFQKKFQLWNNDEVIDLGKKFSEVCPKTILITPDEKGLLFQSCGEVKYFNIATMVDNKPLVLITHSHSGYHPMIAAAIQNQNKKLIVASVLNGNKTKNKKGECIISYNVPKLVVDNKSHDVFEERLSEMFNFDSRAQAVSLSVDGRFLAIAFNNYVKIVDLINKKSRQCNFRPYLKSEFFIVDISEPIDSSSYDLSEKYIATASNQGTVNFQTVVFGDTFIEFQNFKSVEIDDHIEKIHLSHDHHVMYVNEKGQVRIIKKEDWIEHSDGYIKKDNMSGDLGYKGDIDQSLGCGSIHWIDNPGFPECVRFKMHIHRRDGTSAEKFDISIPDGFSKTYSCVTETGVVMSRPTHLSLAAYRNRLVAALLATGEMYLWKIPARPKKKPTEEYARSDYSDDFFKNKLLRGRSSSESKVKEPFHVSLEDMKKKEKRGSSKMSPRGNATKRSKEPIKSSSGSKIVTSQTGSSSPVGRRKKTKDDEIRATFLKDAQNDAKRAENDVKKPE